MCICFLLMTAIWIEIGSIQLRQVLGTEAVDASHPLEVAVTLNASGNYNVQLEQQGRVLQALAVTGRNASEAQSRLSQFLGQVQSLVLAQSQPISVSARIVPSPQVDYGEMVGVLDLLKGYGISALAVVPSRL
jgi:biopolymer transport protein ExbD